MDQAHQTVKDAQMLLERLDKLEQHTAKPRANCPSNLSDATHVEMTPLLFRLFRNQKSTLIVAEGEGFEPPVTLDATAV